MTVSGRQQPPAAGPYGTQMTRRPFNLSLAFMVAGGAPPLTRSSNLCSIVCRSGDLARPRPGRPIAAPLDRCAELLGVDLATVREAAANVEPYIRTDGTKVWSLMQLERQLRLGALGRRLGGYIDRAVIVVYLAILKTHFVSASCVPPPERCLAGPAGSVLPPRRADRPARSLDPPSGPSPSET